MSANVRDELMAIYQQYGRLTAELVVAAASAADHPLHDRFTWDDAQAGAQYRLIEARELIRSVEVRVVRPDKTSGVLRSWIAIPQPEGGHVYEPEEVVAEDPQMIQLAQQEMERDWVALRTRWAVRGEKWMQKAFWRMVESDVPKPLAAPVAVVNPRRRRVARRAAQA